jgi:acyl-coenzyme A synthetase/AMP-(fatty) acid ligase
MIYEEIYRHFQRNAATFTKKDAFIEGDLKISWQEAQYLLSSLIDWLESTFTDLEKESNKQEVVVDGDGCVLHIFVIFALISSYRVYVPYNRTLERNDLTNRNINTTFKVRNNTLWLGKYKFDLSYFLKIKSFHEVHFARHEAPAVFYYTSGTTGKPKIIVSSNVNVLKGAQFVVDALGLINDDVIAGTLLLDFDYGVNQIFCSLLLASTYVVTPFASLKLPWVEEVRRNRVTIVPTMPFLIERYFPTDVRDQNGLVRLCTSSGAPFSSKHADRIKMNFPNCEVIPMYGLSEGFRATIMPSGMYPLKPNSVGLPIGNTEIRVVKQNMEECATLEVGEVLQSSGCVSWGYLNDATATNQKFVRDERFPNKIYIRSGDLGYLDEDGYLFIKGRIEFQIKRYGIRISVDEIESAYKSLEGITNAVVIPREYNETEAIFSVGLVTSLSAEAIARKTSDLPVEFQTTDIKMIPEVLGNYNGGKPDREANRKAYFYD